MCSLSEKDTGHQYEFFSHKTCEFFPCHPTEDPERFNCLFCYCPLYLMEQCGGNYTYTTAGIKDCSQCLIPHCRENYAYIVGRLMGRGDENGE